MPDQITLTYGSTGTFILDRTNASITNGIQGEIVAKAYGSGNGGTVTLVNAAGDLNIALNDNIDVSSASGTAGSINFNYKQAGIPVTPNAAGAVDVAPTIGNTAGVLNGPVYASAGGNVTISVPSGSLDLVSVTSGGSNITISSTTGDLTLTGATTYTMTGSGANVVNITGYGALNVNAIQAFNLGSNATAEFSAGTALNVNVSNYYGTAGAVSFASAGTMSFANATTQSVSGDINLTFSGSSPVLNLDYTTPTDGAILSGNNITVASSNNVMVNYNGRIYANNNLTLNAPTTFTTANSQSISISAGNNIDIEGADLFHRFDRDLTRRRKQLEFGCPK